MRVLSDLASGADPRVVAVTAALWAQFQRAYRHSLVYFADHRVAGGVEGMIRSSGIEVVGAARVSRGTRGRLPKVVAAPGDVEAGNVGFSGVRQHPPHDFPSEAAGALSGRSECHATAPECRIGSWLHGRLRREVFTRRTGMAARHRIYEPLALHDERCSRTPPGKATP